MSNGPWYSFLYSYNFDGLPIATMCLDESNLAVGVSIRQRGFHVKREGREVARMRMCTVLPVDPEIPDPQLIIVMPSMPHNGKRRQVWFEAIMEVLRKINQIKPQLLKNGFRVESIRYADLVALRNMEDAIHAH
jgi:hypothetical protein